MTKKTYIHLISIANFQSPDKYLYPSGHWVATVAFAYSEIQRFLRISMYNFFFKSCVKLIPDLVC